MSFVAYFVRHGQTDWNAEGRLQGEADMQLNAFGRSQAQANGRKLAEVIERPETFDFVASPLSRTRETMELLRTAMGLAPEGYRTDSRIVEVHFGDWQGFTYAELEQRSPGSTARRDADKWNFLPPGEGAESYHMLTRRIEPFLSGLDRDTVCVTHGGIIRTLFHLTGTLDTAACADMVVPQDRVLRLRGGALEWL